MPPTSTVAFIAAGLMLVACAAPSTSNPSPAQIALGKQIFADNCASCHGQNGEGEYPDSPMDPGPDGLIGASPHNSTGHTWHHADDLLLDIIHNGQEYPGFKPMPAFGSTLTDAEIEAVLAYIKTLWTDEQRQMQTLASDPTAGHDVPTFRDLLNEDN